MGNEAYIFGGADRNGTLYGDLMVARPAPTSPVPSACPYRLRLVHGSGGGVESRSGLPVPGIGGHAGVAMEVQGEGGEVSRRMLLYGGIDFSSGEVSSSLLEYSPGGGAMEVGLWRALGQGEGEGRDTDKGKKTGTRIGEPRLVRGEHLPGGRTGHSMSSIPSPVLVPLPPSAAGTSMYPTLPLWAVPGYRGNTPHGSHTALQQHTGPVSLAVLFAGSSPESGPLNDCWLLMGGAGRSSAGAGGGAGGGEEGSTGGGMGQWEYAWSEVETGGDMPKPRELHHAWVRPAVLGVVGSCICEDARPDTPVHVLQPPALCVYGGRGLDREGAPRDDLSVLTLHPTLSSDRSAVEGYTGVWLPSCRTGTGGHAAGAGAGDGMHAFVYGGQAGSGELVGDLWHVDASNGVGGSPAPPPPLSPSSWPWHKVALQGQGGDEQEEEELAVRFASTACMLGGRTLCIFGGMTVLEDTGQLIAIDVA